MSTGGGGPCLVRVKCCYIRISLVSSVCGYSPVMDYLPQHIVPAGSISEVLVERLYYDSPGGHATYATEIVQGMGVTETE